MSFRTMSIVTIISLSTWLGADAQSDKNDVKRPQMNDHESVRALGESQTEPRTRARANAKIIVRSSEAKPHDQIAGPALTEIHLNET